MTDERRWFWRDAAFSCVGTIKPDRDESGVLLVHAPQGRYANERALPLNKYGAGPFCAFRVRGLPHSSGVYVYILGGEPVYVGQAVDLDARFYAYGHISPKTATVAAASRTAA